jgi:hypothetical protein
MTWKLGIEDLLVQQSNCLINPYALASRKLGPKLLGNSKILDLLEITKETENYIKYRSNNVVAFQIYLCDISIFIACNSIQLTMRRHSVVPSQYGSMNIMGGYDLMSVREN